MTEEATSTRIAKERKDEILRHLVAAKSLLDFVDATANFHLPDDHKENLLRLIMDVQERFYADFHRDV